MAVTEQPRSNKRGTASPIVAKTHSARKYHTAPFSAIGYAPVSHAPSIKPTRLWKIVSVVLALLLVISTGCRKPKQDTDADTSKQSKSIQTDPGGKDDFGGDSKVNSATAQKSFSAEDVARMIQKRDRAIARLEAGPIVIDWQGERVSSLKVAAELFQTLLQEIPDDRLPLQDLAVTRTFMLTTAEREKVEPFRAPAIAACDGLLKRFPNDPDGVLLKTKAWLHQVSPVDARARETDAIGLLDQAIVQHPKNLRLWFARFSICRDSRDTKLNDQSSVALTHCMELSSENIYLVTEWLVHLARIKSPKLADEIKRASQIISPLALRIRETKRVDVTQLIQLGLANIDRAIGPMTSLRSVVRPDEISKFDLKNLEPNPMDLVVYEFDLPALRTPAREINAEDSTLKLQLDPQPLAQTAAARQIMCADFDQDGWVDLWILEDDRLVIQGGDRDPAKWKTIVDARVPAGAVGFVTADLDRDRNYEVQAANAKRQTLEQPEGVASVDSDLDVVVYGKSGCLVLKNDLAENGTRSLIPMPQQLGLEKVTGVWEAILVDLDHDYDLDLVTSSDAGTSLWLSMGAFRFANIDAYSHLPKNGRPLRSLVAVDLDRDADIDIVGIDANHQVGFLENMLHVRFRWRNLNDPFPKCDDARAVSVIEADGNASWDLVVARSESTELWRTVTSAAGIRFVAAVPAKGTANKMRAGDWNNDGLQDLLQWQGTPLTIRQGRGAGGFHPWEGSVFEEVIEPDAVEVEDIDRDGDLDLVVASGEQVTLYRNEMSSGNHWLVIHLKGRDDNVGRCNRNGIGSMVELKTADGYQAQVVSRPSVHFGLGSQAKADVMRVVWTNGMPQSAVDVVGDMVICEAMQLKGSCPFIYTWNGTEFEFFTDCLWAAPLGLQVADGVLKPARAWEYVKIPGSKLKPNRGGYELLLTEELWEAGYFDHVELLAIDHPPEIEVYSNEKVGPAGIAEFRVHTVSAARQFSVAIDSQGRDCKEMLSSQDGRFVRAFSKRLRRGLAPEHFIELDFGKLPPQPKLVLFLTGWIFPTDTSLNIAFSQDPELDGPKMPVLQVPDQQGHWKTVIAPMGFPGGKTKTIAVDLQDKFLTSDYRVRIVTSAEIYWDRAFFTLNEEAAPIQIQSLPLTSAQLFERGFSAALPPKEDAPRQYDGKQISHTPKWPPMQGNFTRLGDVHTLLNSADDQLVVIGAADAIRCRFESRPLRTGWKRDFILHSVGWDKDADLNTVYGQNSEPLPFRKMDSYPNDAADIRLENRSYQQYLRRYQTRQQNRRAFWDYVRESNGSR